MIKNILITGMPGSGKSTILDKVTAQYTKKVGFVTREIRKGKDREGFEIETHTGDKIVFAHVSFNTKYKVSKYFVNIDNLESFLPKVSKFREDDILYLDEVGQMQLFSEDFKKIVLKYLDSDNISLLTVSKIYENEFTKSIKNREDVITVEINNENRDFQLNFIENLIKKIIKARAYILDKSRFKIKGDKAIMNSTHAIRNLNYINKKWNCDCDFFKEHSICSHAIAIKEITFR
ncbi:SWIM zinc finger family protein [Candidatus Pacearchaeota archaeon]|nr:SWIM zinc finger family protein [Candidatus Pacearchaeota archaeon]